MITTRSIFLDPKTFDRGLKVAMLIKRERRIFAGLLLVSGTHSYPVLAGFSHSVRKKHGSSSKIPLILAHKKGNWSCKHVSMRKKKRESVANVVHLELYVVPRKYRRDFRKSLMGTDQDRSGYHSSW